MATTTTWPPTLEALKSDMGSEYETGPTTDNARLQQVLDSAVAFVQRVHAGTYKFETKSVEDLPFPPDDLALGTLRLARRLHTRRRTPDGLLEMAELGAARVPSIDPDIDRLLGIGRYRGSMFA